ncbi:hypothetical protein L2E82_13077 [Cichorium intybus]|uniref:Uncharacterized protein n=1 Tax=Cichorium intybus TaxID=13427 RepID=A0ACB9GHU2_CICIN|nr:hypothetical protein L2E82_13077 [Cichorium intybus]
MRSSTSNDTAITIKKKGIDATSRTKNRCHQCRVAKEYDVLIGYGLAIEEENFINVQPRPQFLTRKGNSLALSIFHQGYGAQSPEEKQRLFKLMRNLNFNGESGSEPLSPTTQSSVGIGPSDGLYSPDFKGDFGPGLLDLHAMDDTELHTEQRGQTYVDASFGLPTLEKESNSRENNVAKIKVVVQKRPLNKKEVSRKADDVVTVSANSLTVHEPKLKKISD